MIQSLNMRKHKHVTISRKRLAREILIQDLFTTDLNITKPVSEDITCSSQMRTIAAIARTFTLWSYYYSFLV